MSKAMKKFSVLLITAVIILCSGITVSAEGTVVYEGNANKFIFSPGSEYSPTDLFSEFKGVMPGDSISQQITVRNDADAETKVKIYMRSLGAHDDSEDFLSKLRMTVGIAEDNEMAYMFDAAANETDGLTDWVLLGTLYSGGEVDLEVTLDVPLDIGNEYQDAVGYLDWQFKVEELPMDPDDPKPPVTGDDSNLIFYTIICAISGLILILLLFKRRESAKGD